MEIERIKAPEGVIKLMEELWSKHQTGEHTCGGRAYMVDFPEPTEEEKRIMAENRSAQKPLVIDIEKLQEALVKVGDKLRGW